MKVLFICTGNTCRSPMAAGLLKHYSPDTEVKSAGIYALNGQAANEYSLAVLKEKGIELRHQSSLVTTDLLEWADIVLTMTNNHNKILLQEHPGYQYKIKTLIDFVDASDNSSVRDIADPYGASLDVYRETLQELEQYIKRLTDRLNEKA